jgi:hypothetical protein
MISFPEFWGNDFIIHHCHHINEVVDMGGGSGGGPRYMRVDGKGHLLSEQLRELTGGILLVFQSCHT